MHIAEAIEVRHRACEDKKAYTSPKHAASDATTLRRRNKENVRHYRCPFDSTHYHVGHVPTMESLQTIALAIRVL